MGQSGGESKQPGRWRTLGRWAHRGLLVLLTVLAVVASVFWATSHLNPSSVSLDPSMGWNFVSCGSGGCEAVGLRLSDSLDAGMPASTDIVFLHSWSTPFMHYTESAVLERPSRRWLFSSRILRIELLPTAALFAAWPALWFILRFLRRRKERGRGFEVVQS